MPVRFRCACGGSAPQRDGEQATVRARIRSAVVARFMRSPSTGRRRRPRDRRAGDAQQRPPPGPAVDGADRRCRPRAGSRSRSRSPCCRAARSGRAAARCRARGRGRSRRSRPRAPRRPSGGRTLEGITAAPSRIADAAMPNSTPGSGTPSKPSMPPIAMTIGNATGSTQIAGAPSCAPHRPTATIASTWSSAGDRMQEARSGSRRPRPAGRGARADCVQSAASSATRMDRTMRRCSLHRSAPISSATRWIVQNAPSEPTA